MEESKLFIVSLLFSLIGIIIILIAAKYTELGYTKISEIDKNMVGNYVKIKVQVTSKRELQALYLFTVKDESNSIKVIAYKDDKNLINLKVNQLIEIEGIVKKYKDELEIEANKITI